MFCKTMAAVGTLALLVFGIGCEVGSVHTRPLPAAEVGAPAERLMPPGVEATAFVGGVPADQRVVAPAMIYAVETRLADSETFRQLPPELRVKLSEGLRGYLSARPVGPVGCSILAVDVAGTGNAKQAETLARAAAECYIEHLRDRVPDLTPRPSKALEVERESLQAKLDRVRVHLVNTKRDSPLAAFAERRNLVSIRLEILARKAVEAELAHTKAEAELKTHPADARLRQQQEMTYAAATQQLADLRERLDRAKAEAADLELALGKIAGLRAEERRLTEAIRRIDEWILESRLGALAPGLPVLLGVVSSR